MVQGCRKAGSRPDCADFSGEIAVCWPGTRSVQGWHHASWIRCGDGASVQPTEWFRVKQTGVHPSGPHRNPPPEPPAPVLPAVRGRGRRVAIRVAISLGARSGGRHMSSVPRAPEQRCCQATSSPHMSPSLPARTLLPPVGRVKRIRRPFVRCPQRACAAKRVATTCCAHFRACYMPATPSQTTRRANKTVV